MNQNEFKSFISLVSFLLSLQSGNSSFSFMILLLLHFFSNFIDLFLFLLDYGELAHLPWIVELYFNIKAH